MAPRLSNQRSAEDTVFGNLGLERADLGLGEDQDTGLDTGEDAGEEDEQIEGRQGDDVEDDVSHTPGRLDDLQERRPAPRQDERRPAPIPRGAEVRPDAKGNLVNAQGQVVAKAGSEARLYQNLHRERQAHQATRANGEGAVRDLRTKLQRAVDIGTEIHGRLQQAQAANKQVTDLGLTAAEHMDAIQMAAEAKSNPIGFIRKVLTRAAANGIDLTSLNVGNGGFDPKTIAEIVKAEIAKGLNPLQERSRQQEVQDRARQEDQQALEETEGFFQENQAARAYLPIFHQVLSDPRFANMSLGECWTRIQNEELRRGNDPLNGPRGQTYQNSQRREPTRSLPAGRRNMPPAPRGEMAPVSASYDDILRSVMDDLEV